LIICYSYLFKHFNFINFTDIVTLAYIIKHSLKMMSVHWHMLEYCMKQTLLLIYYAFIGLNNKMWSPYFKEGFLDLCNK